jgi:hypothetical protein
MVPPREKKAAPKAAATKAAKKAAATKAAKTAAKKTTKKSTKTDTGRSKAPSVETQPPGELAEGDGQVHTGLITRMGLIDAPVQFEERDGLAIFEGDIILGTVEELENGVSAAAEAARDFSVGLHTGVEAGTEVEVVPLEGADPIFAAAVIIPGANFRWPQGRVPFEVAGNLTQAARDALTRAVDHWHDNTRLSFRQRRQGYTACLTGQYSTQCSSPVGRECGQQVVNMSANCG